MNHNRLYRQQIMLAADAARFTETFDLSERAALARSVQNCRREIRRQGGAA